MSHTIFQFPVPDYFETHEVLEYANLIRRMNKFDEYFMIVDSITGAEQITVRRMLDLHNNPRGQQIIFSTAGRMTTPDEERFVQEGIKSGWNRVTVTHHGLGMATYSRFTLTRLFEPTEKL